MKLRQIWHKMMQSSLLLMAVTACATSSNQGSPGTNTEDSMAIQEALSEARANPTDSSKARTLAKIYLDAHRYSDAFDVVQGLREREPGSAENLRLLGHACFGLGLFDEAASCYKSARDIEPRDPEAAFWLAYILVSRGYYDDARAVLNPSLNVSSDWRIYELMIGIEPDSSRQLALVSQYRAKVPEDAQAAAVEASLKISSIHQKITSSTPVKAHLSDNYNVDVTINGNSFKLLFDMAASGVAISSSVAKRLGLESGTVTSVFGIGGGGAVEAQEVLLKEVALGGARAENVRARVIQDIDSGAVNRSAFQQASWMGGGQWSTANRSEYDGVIGPSLFSGYSYRIDRKAEVLELFPPSASIPAPAAGALIQPYYCMGPYVLTDVIIRNRINDKAIKAKVVLDTESKGSLYNLTYAYQMDFGKINSTTTTTVQRATGYAKYVEVEMSEMILGSTRFALDRFWATDVGITGYFVPFGVLGHDILGRYRVTVDVKNQTLSFELYDI